MAIAPRSFRSFNGRGQAAQFHRRERRRSHANVPKLYRTHRLVGSGQIGVATVDPSSIFSGRELSPVTFKTAIQISDNASTREGLVFEFSDASGGTALFLSDTTMVAVSGDDAGNDNLSITFDNVVQLPAGAKFDVILALSPGLGRGELWLNGHSVANGVTTSGDFGSIGWFSGDNGSFASAANGAVPAGVSALAPQNFSVIEPLSVYIGQIPRQFDE